MYIHVYVCMYLYLCVYVHTYICMDVCDLPNTVEDIVPFPSTFSAVTEKEYHHPSRTPGNVNEVMDESTIIVTKGLALPVGSSMSPLPEPELSSGVGRVKLCVT